MNQPRSPRLRVPIQRLREGDSELPADQARYVAKVHRLRPGDSFVGFDPEQEIQADVTVVSVSRSRVSVHVGPCQKASEIPSRPLWLLLGMTKADAFDWAIRESTALGVTHILPVVCARTQKIGTLDKKAARWKRLCMQGARQSGRGNIPTIAPPCGLPEALEQVPNHIGCRFCAWEHAGDVSTRWWSREACEEDDSRDVELRGAAWLIGPEGGFTVEEVQAARRFGFRLVTLGPFVLRTETAVIAALGAWQVVSRTRREQ